MVRKVISPLLALTALSLAFSFNGCSCHAQMGTETAKAPEPPPPPPPPPAPAPAPAPAPEAPKPKLMAVGRAKIQDNKVQIPGELEFDVDKATIKNTPQSTEILNTLRDFMKQNAQVTKLRVEGHTDNSGTADHNKALSQQRAEAVAKWLEKEGIDKGRIVAQGYGQDHPVAPNDTADNKQKNRRTEFHVAEMEGKAVEANPPSSAAPTPSAAASTTPPPASSGNPNEKKPDAVKPPTTVKKSDQKAPITVKH
ncbi:MAG: OmpA family protein [Polyangiaceae bacterium]